MTFKKVMLAAAKAGALAAAFNAILFFAFKLAGFITDDILLEPAKQPMTVIPVIFSSIIPSLISGVVLYALLRFSRKGFVIFTAIAIILLLASFVNPFVAIPGVTLAYGVALNVMHVVVVATLLYFYRRDVYLQARV